MSRLDLTTLRRVTGARAPAYDPARLGVGLVHVGVGAFHRAHQAVFTEDAIEAAGGDWGIAGVSLRRPDAARDLTPQEGLYTLETRSQPAAYRVIGALRSMDAAVDRDRIAPSPLAGRAIHVVTVTVTEAGYDPGADPDRSAAGWLTEGLAQRRAAGGGPLTILSCDNLRRNGARLAEAVGTLARRRDADLAAWIAGEVAFPDTMVDAITPASDDALRARVARVIGLEDRAAVQREPFAAWVIEDRFAGPRPAWERVGVELVADIAGHEALKLHVLNAVHSVLAVLGPPRGHALVREAMNDSDLAALVDAMVIEEVAPFLPARDVTGYWRTTAARLRQPAMDHRLDQIARDDTAKLRERLHPVLIANARSGRPTARIAGVVRAWLANRGGEPAEALADPALFEAPFRTDPAVRAAILAGGR